jgi:CheY-like chemotaxis protein
MPLNMLLIEDEPDIQTVVKLALVATGGHHVTVADDGLTGLESARMEQPDVILLDVMMPRMDGHELIRLLKAGDRTSGIPVIFLTAKAQQKDIDDGMLLGADGYLLKPFDSLTLSDQREGNRAQCHSGRRCMWLLRSLGGSPNVRCPPVHALCVARSGLTRPTPQRGRLLRQRTRSNTLVAIVGQATCQRERQVDDPLSGSPVSSYASVGRPDRKHGLMLPAPRSRGV